jgi:iron complex outermembrane receptor protein
MVPESEVMPQTDGVLGVKKFENISKANLYGFEFSWFSPGDLRFGGSLIAAYTAGYLPETEKYIIENGEVVGSETIKNDPLPEIQPFETTVRTHYKWLAGKLVPEISLRFVAAQNRISESYGESETPGFILAGFNIDYQINNILNLSGGVSNLFNENYYEHLNRRIIGSRAELLEPGRIFYLKMTIEL